MTEKDKWELNDFKVDDLRRRMAITRELYLKKNPNVTEEAINNFITKTFKNESMQIAKEQMLIISKNL